jgi:hypothetical protein
MNYEFDIEAVHACGHKERHTGGTANGDMTWLMGHWSREKCSHCRPRCRFCGRSGDRENMLVTPEGLTFCNAWCHGQGQHQTHYSEHNDIAVPSFLRHWDDASWHNDTCARSEYTIGKGLMRIWVDRDDPQERNDPSLPRFVVFYYASEEDSGDADIAPIYEGNDEAEVALWAHAAEIVVCGSDPDDNPLVAPKVAQLKELGKWAA